VEPYTREFIVWTLPTTAKGTAKIIPGHGVKVNYIYYWNDAFKSPLLENTSVPVRYNPFDVSQACAYVGGRWIDLVSEYAVQFRGRSEREIKLISAEIRERQRKTHERRNVNAQIIAAYMEEADQTERVLLQRMRDQEMQNAQQGSRDVPSSSEPAAAPPMSLEPEVSVADAPDLPAPKQDDGWYDEDVENENLEPLKDFS
jgi:putative transposase